MIADRVIGHTITLLTELHVYCKKSWPYILMEKVRKKEIKKEKQGQTNYYCRS